MIHPDLSAAAAGLATGALTADRAADAAGDEGDLANVLYVWYLNAVPFAERTDEPLRPAEFDLTAALRAAHHDAPRFEGGWRVESVSTWGRTMARKENLTRVLDRSEYTVPGRPGLPARPGDALLVSRCWEWTDDQTGFWHARRGAWPPPDADRLVRLYWNTEPSASPRVVAALSGVLAEVPTASYMMKTPASGQHGGRADSLVLYLGPRGFATLEHRLRAQVTRLHDCLRAEVPRFTWRVADGVAIGESRLSGDSFGETRCAIVASAYYSADLATRRSPSRLGEQIAASFSGAGLDPRRPYLERGATRDYVA